VQAKAESIRPADSIMNKCFIPVYS
jgi:hypothetical protein